MESRGEDKMTLIEAYKDKIAGVLTCYDRVLINGVAGAPGCSFGYAGGMACFFNINHFKMFDFAGKFKPVTEAIIGNAEEIAKKNGIQIEYIRSTKAFRKEDKITEVLERRGNQEGLVHIFSALEMNTTYKPWCDREQGTYCFNVAQTKCLTYYFYFIDREFGLCFLRVPTIAPFRVTFYYNGHNWLEHKMQKNNIPYKKQDNAFVSIDDFDAAQALSDKLRIEDLHQGLDSIVKGYCPLPEEYGLKFNWTIHQVEYAMDIVFKKEDDLKPVYDNIIKTAMHTITPENIATILGKRFSVLFDGEAGSRYDKRILGTRIKHQMGQKLRFCSFRENIRQVWKRIAH
jgi:hypothetical protein